MNLMGIGFGAVVSLGLANAHNNVALLFIPDLCWSGGRALYNRDFIPKTPGIIAKLIYELPDRLKFHWRFCFGLKRRVCWKNIYFYGHYYFPWAPWQPAAIQYDFAAIHGHIMKMGTRYLCCLSWFRPAIITMVRMLMRLIWKPNLNRWLQWVPTIFALITNCRSKVT